MNKKDLIAKIADATDVSQSKASEMVNAMTDCIVTELKKGDGHEVNLPGFGKCKIGCKQQRQNYDSHENLQNSKRIFKKDTPANG